MIKLRPVTTGDSAHWSYIIALFVKAYELKCPLLELTKSLENVENINAVMDWLVTNYPDEFTYKDF